MMPLLKYILIFLLFCQFSSCTVAQTRLYSSTNKKAIKNYEKALMCFNTINHASGKGDLKGAEQYLKKAIGKDSSFHEAYSLYSNVALEKGDIENGIYYRKKMMEKNTNVPLVEYYFLAGMQMATGDYRGCLRNARKYSESPLANKNALININRMIENCVFALKALENKSDLEPINLGKGVNSAMPEYFPSVTADDSTLLFTRMINDERAPLGTKQEDIFVSQRVDNEWSDGFSISNNINSSYNEGAPTFSSDGQYIIFVGCETGAKGDYEYGYGRKGYGSCDLFYSQKIGDEWSSPVNLGPPINSRHWETQPSFSSDGKTLYFVRGLTYDRQRRNPDDQDIFYSEITPDGWSKPKRLPKNINTPFREESVQIHPDGKTLYFSSNGHPGMGGLDIFMSRKQVDGSWSNPINLGYPLNTYVDENSLLVSSDGELGYFASNREGGYGSLDIYSFKLDSNVMPLPITFLKGLTYDEETNKPIPAHFQLTALNTGNVISEINANQGDGSFLITLPQQNDLAFHAEYEGYVLVSKNFTIDLLELTEEGYLLDIPMSKIKPGTFVLENIFFEVNKFELQPASITELEKVYKMLDLNKDIEVEISGHTDSDGNDQDNMVLSENRAQAVVDWLVEKGISSSRLSFKGYGETKPIVDNSSKENKAKNRRTELTIK